MNRRFIYSSIVQLSLSAIVALVFIPIHLNVPVYLLLLGLFVLAVKAYDDTVDNRHHKH